MSLSRRGPQEIHLPRISTSAAPPAGLIEDLADAVQFVVAQGAILASPVNALALGEGSTDSANAGSTRHPAAPGQHDQRDCPDGLCRSLAGSDCRERDRQHVRRRPGHQRSHSSTSLAASSSSGFFAGFANLSKARELPLSLRAHAGRRHRAGSCPMTTTSSPTASLISIRCRCPSGALDSRIAPPARPARSSAGHFRARSLFADVVTAATLGGNDSHLRVPLADDLALFADVQVTTCASAPRAT